MVARVTPRCEQICGSDVDEADARGHEFVVLDEPDDLVGRDDRRRREATQEPATQACPRTTPRSPADAAAIGLDVDARPSFDEVIEVRAERMAVVRRIVDDLTDEELERLCARSPVPGYPEEPLTVGECLRVVMTQECEHHRYAVRDLAVLEART